MTAQDTTQGKDTFDQFCIIDLFGHSKIAGRVTEQTIGGQSFIRVDVPSTQHTPAYTRLFSAGAIYSMTPVSEEIALRAAAFIRAEPVQVYIGQHPQLVDDNDDDEEEF